jgi:archaellum biogenesis ATPase FlaH
MQDPNILATVSMNSTFSSNFQYTEIEDVLGGIERDTRGNIVSAAATLAVYVTKVDSEGSIVSMMWEKEYLKIVSEEFETFTAQRWTRVRLFKLLSTFFCL